MDPATTLSGLALGALVTNFVHWFAVRRQQGISPPLQGALSWVMWAWMLTTALCTLLGLRVRGVRVGELMFLVWLTAMPLCWIWIRQRAPVSQDTQ